MLIGAFFRIPAPAVSLGQSSGCRGSGAQPRQRQFALRAQQPQRQLFLAHFEREHRHRHAEADRGVLGHVHGGRRLSHRRSAGEDDQVAGLPAARELVEIVPAARNARDLRLALEESLDLRHRGHHQVADAGEALANALVRDLEDAGLGLIEQRRGLVLPRVALLLDLTGRADQPAQDRLLVHDPDVVFDVRRGGRVLHDLRQRRRTARGFEIAALAQFLRDRDEVGGFLAFVERDQGGEDLRVRGPVERARVDVLDRPADGAGVEHHGREDGAFGFERLRRRQPRRARAGIARRVVGHGDSLPGRLPRRPHAGCARTMRNSLELER